MSLALPDVLIGFLLVSALGAFVVLAIAGVMHMREGSRQARATAAEIEACEAARASSVASQMEVWR